MDSDSDSSCPTSADELQISSTSPKKRHESNDQSSIGSASTNDSGADALSPLKSSNGKESSPTEVESPPTKRHRKSAELANKRMLKPRRQSTNLVNNKNGTEIGNSFGGGGPSDPEKSNSSREGSFCDQKECMMDKRCSIGVSQSCINQQQSDDPAKSTNFHISKSEHVCYFCYEEFRIGKPMFERFSEWKSKWVKESRCVPNLRLFIFNDLMPFYVDCHLCGRFRRVPRSASQTLDSTDIRSFTCKMVFPQHDTDGIHSCTIEEDKEVTNVRDQPSAYIKSLSAPPLLHNSPVLHYLKNNEYYNDEIGISPTNANFELEEDCKTSAFMCPFNIPDEQSKAFSLRPDIMEYDEVYAFPEFSVEPIPYLAMRNLVVALWSLNPFEYLTFEKCFAHLICPGLVRVWYSRELRRVLEYLTLKCVINYGIFQIPRLSLFKGKKMPQLSVVVVGGGLSGLGAARQLRAFGANVTVLEAKTKIGGRMQDDWSLGVAVGCGAQLITGIVNNPVVLMCHQIGLNYRPLSVECPLLDGTTGRQVTTLADRVVDEHFNCMLDAIGQWKSERPRDPDSSLLIQINALHTQLIKSVNFHWAKEFDRLLQWQIGNVEFSCGANLSEVSAKHWDQNESVSQFAGLHALLSDGTGPLIRRLAEGCDVRCGHQVERVEYGPGTGTNARKVLVECTNGKSFHCDKVLFCLPLTVYQKGFISFSPELPSKKRMAIRSLGAGLIEKIAVQFPRRFWSSLLKNDGTIDYFGNVPKEGVDRGLFNMFYDFSTRGTSKSKMQSFVLMSYICGESVELVNQKSDVEVVEQFLCALRELFPDETIPHPTGYVVTHWGRDPHIGMSYSFVKVGSSGEDYDALATTVANRLYFAGECTNRFFPQTMTGAYVSALRESSKMAEQWILQHQSNPT